MPIISLFSNSEIGYPSTPGLKWNDVTFPSWVDANKKFPLKPQLKSVTPIVQKSIITANGFVKWGFQTEMVES